MRWLVGLNAAGGLAATLYAAAVFAPSHTPAHAGIAILIYFAGAAQPLFAHQMALDTGFREVERDYMNARHREIGMGPAAEIITDEQPNPSFQKKSGKNRFTLIAFVIGSGLMIYDSMEWWMR